MSPADREPDLEALLDRHLPAVRAFVRLRAGPAVAAREASSDLVQSVCRELLAAEGHFEYRSEAAFRSWLYTTALRKIVEKDRFYRAQRRDLRREVVGGGTGDDEARSLLDCYQTLVTPSRDVAAREQIARVEEAFQRLSETDREVVTLARIVGLPHAEIAQRIGKTVEASRAILRRALVRLAELLEPGEP